MNDIEAICLDVAIDFSLSAGPINLNRFHRGYFSQAEMKPTTGLREESVAGMQRKYGFLFCIGNDFHSSPNRIFVGRRAVTTELYGDKVARIARLVSQEADTRRRSSGHPQIELAIKIPVAKG